ncbi:MAG: hypothetical protein JW863_16480 [Chitinispirillaceae bacterium]|nr:hypothetical protein [Chitinispirillaceae bacterium]
MSIDVSGADEVYLVVTATPTEYARIVWDQMNYTIYRCPYMVEVTKPGPFEWYEPVGVHYSRAQKISNFDVDIYPVKDGIVRLNTVMAPDAWMFLEITDIKGRLLWRGGIFRTHATLPVSSGSIYVW